MCGDSVGWCVSVIVTLGAGLESNSLAAEETSTINGQQQKQQQQQQQQPVLEQLISHPYHHLNPNFAAQYPITDCA